MEKTLFPAEDGNNCLNSLLAVLDVGMICKDGSVPASSSGFSILNDVTYEVCVASCSLLQSSCLSFL